MISIIRSGSARSFNTQYGHLSPASSQDEDDEEDGVEEEEARSRKQRGILVEEQEKIERGRPERRKTQRIEYGRGVDEDEEERKRLENELDELNRQQLEDEMEKEAEQKRKAQDESDRQSVILEMIGGLKPPSGSRARSVPRGRRREKVAVEVNAPERGRSPGAVSVRSMISLHQPEAMSMKEEKDHMQVPRIPDDGPCLLFWSSCQYSS